MTEKKPTFEQALKQLETIAEQIERGTIGLEESIVKYEEGMALVRHCREILSKAELKIQQLQQQADGTLRIVEYERKENEEE
jgi:exodeoxyribonuclease VII small subunit